ncbi:MAG: class I SAM-dependent methyltransferase [Polyangiaceae bacterium]
MRRTLEPEVMDTAEDAEEYDAMDFTEPDTRFAEAAAALLGDSRGGRALDIGTGTAKIPILLLAHRPDLTVLAVDMAEQMLRVAKTNLERAGLAASCSIARMDAKALDVPAAELDLVMSNSLAHHVPDPLDLFREIARVVKPGGAVLVRDLLRPDSVEEAWAIVNRVSPDDTPRQRQLFFDSLCAALTLDEVRAMVDAAGLTGATVSQVSDRHWSVERRRTSA